MIKRELVQVNTGMRSLDNTEKANYKTISDNYFPVDTAIVMRDLSKKIRFTSNNFERQTVRRIRRLNR